MKKLGLFLSARPEDGGMFQYSQAVLTALAGMPAGQYSLSVAYAASAWKEILPRNLDDCFPVKLGRLKSWLTLLPAFLPQSSRSRWDRSRITRLSGWADDLLRRACDLWIFPRQEVWSALFPQPALACVHDLMHLYEPHFPENAGFCRNRYRDAYLRSLCLNASGILVDSELGKRHVEESYSVPPGKIFVLPYIPPALFAPGCSSPMKGNFESRFDLPDKYIFYPAQFWRHKNHMRLIKAVLLLKKILPEIQLVLTGAKKHGYWNIRREVNRLGLERNVRFAGYVAESDLAEFYRRARGLILPTLFGPTNIPPLEAFALGCPVAASGIYGMPEQVGAAGILFDPYSVESIADSIRRLWTDDSLCLVLRANGRARSAAWGPVQFATRLHEIIGQLTGQHRP